MVKTQQQVTHHEMEMMIQAAVIVFFKKGYICLCNYKSFFGASKATIASVWRLIYPGISGKLQIKHLLWALTFLTQYSCEQVVSQAADCTSKIFRKRVLEVLTALNKQYNDVVSTIFNSFFWACKMPRCRLMVPAFNKSVSKLRKKWFSHKFRWPGLHYEVALTIQKGNIVWSHGPFPPGAHIDLAIFLQGLAHKLKPGETVEADKGYRGCPRFVDCPNTSVGSGPLQQSTKANVRLRHELCNSRLKSFEILSTAYRHSRKKHSLYFRCVLMITQLYFETGSRLPQVKYTMLNDEEK